ncbi:MAG: ribonuclease III [Clostridia bacterium]|nr:ribonuclease III [Clostridia bacterium]
MSKQQAGRLSALRLAYVGDTVCDLMIRTDMMFSDLPIRDMHKSASAVVNARAQAEQLSRVFHLLEEDERQIVQRARNSHPGHSIPQAASREEYMAATGFEALMGYLYLTGQMLRAQMLFRLSIIKE